MEQFALQSLRRAVPVSKHGIDVRARYHRQIDLLPWCAVLFDLI
jgi:hypothetical protein